MRQRASSFQRAFIYAPTCVNAVGQRQRMRASTHLCANAHVRASVHLGAGMFLRACMHVSASSPMHAGGHVSANVLLRARSHASADMHMRAGRPTALRVSFHACWQANCSACIISCVLAGQLLCVYHFMRAGRTTNLRVSFHACWQAS